MVERLQLVLILAMSVLQCEDIGDESLHLINMHQLSGHEYSPHEQARTEGKKGRGKKGGGGGFRKNASKQ